ncbi:hypothetical protein PMAYCL1PPCAC_04586, partial [Pristionchus mayeri]
HFKIMRADTRIYPECSIPHPFSQHQPPMVLYKEVHRIEADESRAVLKKLGILLHLGLPICPTHNDEVRKIVTEVAVEETGYELRPSSRIRNPSHSAMDTDDANARGKVDIKFVNKEKKPKAELEKAYAEFMNAIGLHPYMGTWNDLK